MNELTEEKAREIAAAHAEKYGGKMICVCFKCQRAEGYLLRVEQEKAHLSEREAEYAGYREQMVRNVKAMEEKIAEREAVIARLRDEVKEANIGEFDAMLMASGFKDRFYEKCEETEALKSKLGEAEKALKTYGRCACDGPGQQASCFRCGLCEFLSSLRTPSDGEGKS